MATPLSEVKRILGYFPPRPGEDKAGKYGDCSVCLSGVGRSKCREAAVELVRETAAELNNAHWPIIATLPQLTLFIEESGLWDEYPEDIATRIMDPLNY